MSTTRPAAPGPRLTSLSHGAGCGFRIAPGAFSGIVKRTHRMPMPPERLIGIEAAGDAAQIGEIAAARAGAVGSSAR